MAKYGRIHQTQDWEVARSMASKGLKLVTVVDNGKSTIYFLQEVN